MSNLVYGGLSCGGSAVLDILGAAARGSHGADAFPRLADEGAVLEYGFDAVGGDHCQVCPVPFERNGCQRPDRNMGVAGVQVKWSGKFRQDAKVVSMRWETYDGTPQIHGRVQAQGGYSGHAWGRNGAGHSRSAWHQRESTEQVEDPGPRRPFGGVRQCRRQPGVAGDGQADRAALCADR